MEHGNNSEKHEYRYKDSNYKRVEIYTVIKYGYHIQLGLFS